nr:hypothetical protein BAR15_180229 [Bartonella sp. AR 15-3]
MMYKVICTIVFLVLIELSDLSLLLNIDKQMIANALLYRTIKSNNYQS